MSAEERTARRPLVPAQRRRLIADRIRNAGSVTVATLEAEFGVSPMTARRDLQILEREGRARRTHGGAVAPTLARDEDAFQSRLAEAAEAKRRLGERAAALIGPGETVFVDCSTTAYHAVQLADGGAAARRRSSRRRVAVMDLIARSDAPQLELLGLAGSLRRLTRSFVGPQTVRAIGDHFADKLLLSVKGLGPGNVLTDANPLEAEVKRTMIARARESILLIDETKLDNPGLSAIAPLTDVDLVLVDRRQPRPAARAGRVGRRDRGGLVSDHRARPDAEKSYGAVRALRDGTLALEPGEVRALVGENGAGKSTLVKLLAGVVRLDNGEMRVDGEPVDFHSPTAARDAGIAVIYQEPTLFPDLQHRGERRHGPPPAQERPPHRPPRDARPGPGAARPPRRGARRRAPRARPEHRRPADRRDRQGAVLRGARADHGRADRRAVGQRGRAAVHASSRRAARAGRRRAVHLAPPRGGVRDLRHRHRDARRRRRARGEHRRDRRRRAGAPDGRPRPRRAVPQGGRRRSASRCSRCTGSRARACSSTSPSRSRRARSSRWPGSSARAAARSPARSSASTSPTPATSRSAGAGSPPGRPLAAMRAGIGFVPEDRRQQGLVMDLSIARNATMTRTSALARGGLIRGGAEDTPGARSGPRACSSSSTGSRTPSASCRAATSRRSCSPSGSPPSRSC